MSQLPDPFDNLEIVEALFIMQRPYVGMSQLNRLNEIIAKYPEYFPWETKYRETPKEVHEAFRKEAYPSIYEERPIEFTGGIGGGIMDQIKKASVAPSENEKTIDMANKAVAYFTSKGIDKMKIFSFLKVTNEKEIGTNELIILQGIKTGLTEGEFTIADAFSQTEGEKGGKAVTNNVEEKLSTAKKAKSQAKPIEQKEEPNYVGEAIDFGIPRKRTPEQLSHIELCTHGAEADDFEAAGLVDFLGVKDLALNGTSEQINSLLIFLASK